MSVENEVVGSINPDENKASQANKAPQANNSCEEDGEWVPIQEQLIHADVEGLYRDDVLKSSCLAGTTQTGENSSVFQLTGLETQEPMLQIGRQVFAGTYCDSTDTFVYFRCEPSRTSRESSILAGEPLEDEIFSQPQPRLSAKLDCKTRKKLTFKRVFLEPIASQEGDNQSVDQVPS